MSAFVCTIAKKSPSNWDLCKEVRAYGIPGSRAPARAVSGDRLFFWVGGRGYVAEAEVTATPKVPASKSEAPWPGGTYQYGFIVPFTLVLEVEDPVYYPFDDQRQRETGISKTQLQRSFSLISSSAADAIHRSLLARVTGSEHSDSGRYS